MNKLFIIGNGFDCAHSLKTTYDDFRTYLLSNHPEINMNEFITPEAQEQPDGGVEYDETEVLSMLFYLINEAESNADKWCDIESSLGRLDFSEAFDWYDDILDKDGDIDLFKTVYRNEDLSSVLVFPTTTIQELFYRWINTINISSVEPIGDFQMLLSDNDKFLTFNYTETLEEVYGVNEENICHIHGKQNEQIFFGHGNSEDNTDYFQKNHVGSEDNLTLIHNKLRKKTEVALKKNLDFFTNLENYEIGVIYSNGFSFSGVDEIYLAEICNRINTENIVWYFNDYDKKSKLKSYEDTLKKCGYKGTFDTFHI